MFDDNFRAPPGYRLVPDRRIKQLTAHVELPSEVAADPKYGAAMREAAQRQVIESAGMCIAEKLWEFRKFLITETSQGTHFYCDVEVIVPETPPSQRRKENT